MSVIELVVLGLLATFALASPLLIVWFFKDLRRSTKEHTPVSGAAGGLLSEIDRIARPSIEHTEQAQEQQVERIPDDGA